MEENFFSNKDEVEKNIIPMIVKISNEFHNVNMAIVFYC